MNPPLPSPASPDEPPGRQEVPHHPEASPPAKAPILQGAPVLQEAPILQGAPVLQEAPLLFEALRLAQRGWAVIPLVPGRKRPLVRDWPQRATTGPAQIRRWWGRWPRANVGVACGPSGLVVIDLDVRGGARGPAAWEALCAELGVAPWDTLTATTPSGGRHLYYTAPEGVPAGHRLANSAGKLGPGIDVRAGGGYVVAPPSRAAGGGWAWLELRPVRPLPAPVAHRLAARRTAPPAPAAALHTYVRAALEAEAGRVACAPEGTRNDALNAAAYSLGQLVAAPWAGLAEGAVREVLLRAARACGLPEGEAAATIESGLAGGMARPRPAPQRGPRSLPPPVKDALQGGGVGGGPSPRILMRPPPDGGGEGSPPPTLRPKGEEKGAPRRKDGSVQYRLALEDLGYAFQMNVCNDRVLVNGAPMTDPLAAKIRTQMRDLGFTHMPAMEDAYLAEASDHPWHPVQAYLDGLHWDGTDAIGALAARFQDERGVLPLFLRRWLIGAVAKAYEGTQNRMLILDGAQQLGKSHFVRWLCSPLPDLLVEGPINPDNKDDRLRLISCWIWEVAELGSTTRKADRESLKHFLTVRQVTVRKLYARYDTVKPALASFIGTVNNEAGVLSDPTGSRRFMSAHLLAIDWGYTAIDVDQVWAQAAALYRAGEPWVLRDEEAAAAQAANEAYEVDDPLTGYVDRCFEITRDPADRMPTCDILDRLHATGWPPRYNSTAESMALSAVLKPLGLKQYKGGYKRGWCGIRLRQRDR